jgi:hypothetical protein
VPPNELKVDNRQDPYGTSMQKRVIVFDTGASTSKAKRSMVYLQPTPHKLCHKQHHAARV